MQIYGLDFTSSPTRRKPITCAHCELHDAVLIVKDGLTMSSFAEFEAFLRSDGPWLAAFEAVVPPLLRRFQPTVLVTQDGCDTHLLDPLAHLRASTRIWPHIGRRFHELAHELCDGRWVALGGGGYAVEEVVPRAWTLLFAEMVESPAAAVEPLSAISFQRSLAGAKGSAGPGRGAVSAGWVGSVTTLSVAGLRTASRAEYGSYGGRSRPVTISNVQQPTVASVGP